MGVRLRRRFGFQHGTVTAYEDEATRRRSDAIAARAEPTCTATILEAEIERPRIGPDARHRRDHPARAGRHRPRPSSTRAVCVQGAPGTGKTAVGLHRAAYLLYAHRDQLSRQGVLVVGPNDVLPALHRRRAAGARRDRRQADHRRGARRDTCRSGPSTRSTRRGSRATPGWREVLERALWSHDPAGGRGPGRAAAVRAGGGSPRTRSTRSSRSCGDARRPVRRRAGPCCRSGSRTPCSSRWSWPATHPTTGSRTRSRAAGRSRQHVDALWPVARPDPAGDAAARRRRASWPRRRRRPQRRGAGDADLWPRRRRARASAPWSLHDAVLIDEARDLLDRTPSLGHVVLDEAQDLSPMMLRSVGRQCSTGSATILGDLAQATTPWSCRRWDEALATSASRTRISRS